MPTVLPQPEEKARSVKEMFDRIAPGYDRVNRLLTGNSDQRWRRALIGRLGIGDSDRVLDLACGTGQFADMAREYSQQIVGLDFARQMLVGAQARDMLVVGLVQGDATRLPFADGSFTVAVSGFALRNFTSIPLVLAELARVLKPGGRIGLLEVDRPKNAVVRTGHSLYFDRVVPLVGGLVSDRQAYRYLPESAVYLPPQDEFVRMLVDAGFHRVRKTSPMFGAIQSVSAERK